MVPPAALQGIPHRTKFLEPPLEESWIRRQTAETVSTPGDPLRTGGASRGGWGQGATRAVGFVVAGLALASIASGAQLRLNWADNSDNESGFTIERALASGDFTEIASVAPNTTTYTDSNLPAATTYRYRVSAFNAFGRSAYSNVAMATTAVEIPPIPGIAWLVDQVAFVGQEVVLIAFSVEGGLTGPENLVIAATSSNPAVVPAAGIVVGGTGSTRVIRLEGAARAVGAAEITVTATDGISSTSGTFQFSVRPTSEAPSISVSPSSGVVIAGQELVLRLGSGEAWDSVQWFFDGELLPGATGGELAIPSVQVSHGGVYQAVLRVGGVAVQCDAVVVDVTAPGPGSARLVNLSARALCGTGPEALMSGFVVRGTQAKSFLLRVVGPTLGLPPFDVPGVLPDPHLTLKRWNGQGYDDIATSDDWGDSTDAAAVRQAETATAAFPLPEGSRDAAIVVDLSPGTYVLVSEDRGGESGVALAELYDASLEEDGLELVNISNRAFVGTGAGVSIGGFVVAGTGTKTFLIRAVGPTLGLAPFLVPGFLADPAMEVWRAEPSGGATMILSNDDWGAVNDPVATAEVARSVGAFALAEGSRDAALVVSLDPGVYTILVRGDAALGAGEGSGTAGSGLAIVEVYPVR